MWGSGSVVLTGQTATEHRTSIQTHNMSHRALERQSKFWVECAPINVFQALRSLNCCDPSWRYDSRMIMSLQCWFCLNGLLCVRIYNVTITCTSRKRNSYLIGVNQGCFFSSYVVASRDFSDAHALYITFRARDCLRKKSGPLLQLLSLSQTVIHVSAFTLLTY